ncbi:hypothetical protein EYZ11_012887 [Aspergillus tanneri]|uniref:ATP synthase assembly factor FMC1, mitochondrial n=1 Tax=Aspergillus tanneri TaxID=1220188 RepID=A0A4S3IZ32_9EURO|nr:uncharacterized protein ATNIH1004_004403 [Aspergillus tanneri]KAA8648518.1 hypothetical protein ATNIH1004_004403 [Aspergillus tanneri]THC87669.1 hypothetical protein EYZ11_012887 [Aspergillus tanneri]
MTKTNTLTTYRSLLRELPRRSLSSPTPLHQRIRALYRQPVEATVPQKMKMVEEELSRRLQEAEQMALYARSQRQYVALLERYNPGMSLDEQEKIRLTARRVGLDIPAEVEDANKKTNTE